MLNNYKEIKGDLIALAKQGEFDVIAHGCNCFCTMGAGIAPQMAKAFGCDRYPLEHIHYRGEVNKLGQIQWGTYIDNEKENEVKVVNAYTQFHYGGHMPLDYEALRLCLRKINYIFNHNHIGLPQIGCGLAGGNWDIVSGMIQQELKNCQQVTIVIYDK